MRYQGRITDWRDDRGFGFITPKGGDATVFVHISAFDRSRGRPRQGALVTYELATDEKKGDRAIRVRYLGERPTVARRTGGRRGALIPTVVILCVIGALAYGWRHFRPILFEDLLSLDHVSSGAGDALPSGRETRFECRGKIYCSEMSSCGEAIFYLRHCPGVKMDGDGDGIPCESQWCGH